MKCAVHCHACLPTQAIAAFPGGLQALAPTSHLEALLRLLVTEIRKQGYQQVKSYVPYKDVQEKHLKTRMAIES